MFGLPTLPYHHTVPNAAWHGVGARGKGTSGRGGAPLPLGWVRNWLLYVCLSEDMSRTILSGSPPTMSL